MEQLLSTPVRPGELVLGKLSAFFALGMIDLVVCLVVGVFVFGVPFKGSVVLLFVSSCLFLFGALCWGVFISASTRSQLVAYQMGTLTSFLPAFLLSGFIYGIQNMPVAHPGIYLPGAGAVLRDAAQGYFPERRRLAGVVGGTRFLTGLRRHRVSPGQPQNAREGSMIERLLVLIRKELLQTLRNPRMRAMLILPPIIQLLIFGYAANMDIDNARIAWMDLDRSPDSRDLLSEFQGSGTIRVRSHAGARFRHAIPAGPEQSGRGHSRSAGFWAGHCSRPDVQRAGAGGWH